MSSIESQGGKVQGAKSGSNSGLLALADSCDEMEEDTFEIKRDNAGKRDTIAEQSEAIAVLSVIAAVVGGLGNLFGAISNNT